MTANRLATDAVIAAVIAALRADGTLAALLSVQPGGGSPAVPAVYDGLAPQAAPYDYLVVTDGGETPANTLGRGWGAASLVYLRATSRRAATARALASRAVAVLDAPETALAVAGYASAVSELVTGGPAYDEEVRGEVIWHHPAAVRVTVHGIVEGSPA